MLQCWNSSCCNRTVLEFLLRFERPKTQKTLRIFSRFVEFNACCVVDFSGFCCLAPVQTYFGLKFQAPCYSTPSANLQTSWQASHNPPQIQKKTSGFMAMIVCPVLLWTVQILSTFTFVKSEGLKLLKTTKLWTSVQNKETVTTRAMKLLVHWWLYDCNCRSQCSCS